MDEPRQFKVVFLSQIEAMSIGANFEGVKSSNGVKSPYSFFRMTSAIDGRPRQFKVVFLFQSDKMPMKGANPRGVKSSYGGKKLSLLL